LFFLMYFAAMKEFIRDVTSFVSDY
jgi:hypothetical protein